MSHKHNLNTYTPDFTIDPITREITQVSNPENPIRLMQFDHNSEKLRFSCPRYIDGHDMALCDKLEVHFVNSDVANAINNSGAYRVVDLEVDSADSSKINFSWVVSKNATGNVGTLVFSVRFTCLSGDEIDYVWHTLSFTYISVDQGLVSEIDPEYQKVYLDNLETEAGKKVVEAGEATATALEAAERASEAVNDLYGMDVTDKAPAIVCGVTGKVVSITDSAEMPLKGLRLFGKSVQDGTPTPDAPVEIESVESPSVTVCGKNLLPDVATSESYSGITLVVNEDKSITVNGTATEHVFYAPYKFTFKAGQSYVLSGCPTGGSGDTYFMYINNLGGMRDYGNGVVVKLDEDFTSDVGFCIRSGTKIDNLTFYPMVTVGTVADGYEPSKVSQIIKSELTLHGIPVTSGGNYTDKNGQQWICDEVDLERGVYVQRTATVVVNGSKNPSTFATGNKGGSVFAYSYDDLKMNILRNREHKLCDRLQRPPTTNPTSFKDCEVGYWGYNTVGSNDMFIVMNVGKFDSVDDVKSWLSENPVTFVYVLDTPIETPLTEIEIAAYKALHTNYPNTVVMSEADVEVKYAADTKLYIDNKIKELVTALVNN